MNVMDSSGCRTRLSDSSTQAALHYSSVPRREDSEDVSDIPMISSHIVMCQRRAEVNVSKCRNPVESGGCVYTSPVHASIGGRIIVMFHIFLHVSKSLFVVITYV